MTQLEAVNLILRALSEHTVASVEIRHPSVTLALSWLERAREELNGQAWWYNTYPTSLTLQSDGRIQIPEDTLFFIPDNFEGIVIDGYLYNVDTMSSTFTAAVTGFIHKNTDFDNLPSPAQAVVAYRAAILAYGNDVGDSGLNEYRVGYTQALELLAAQHARQRRYNARSRRSWQRYLNALRG